MDGDCDLLDESKPEKPYEVEKEGEECKAMMVQRLICKELEARGVQ